MSLIGVLAHRAGPRALHVIGASAVGGLLTAATVSAANATLVGAAPGASLWRAVAFLGALAVMLVSSTWAARATAAEFEGLQAELRRRYAAAIERAPLRRVEGLGEASGQVVADLSFLAAASPQLVGLLQHAAFVFAITAIIGLTSTRALVIWLLTVALVTARFRRGLRALPERYAEQSERVGHMRAHLADFVDGFAQLEFDRPGKRRVLAALDRSRAAMLTARDDLAERINRTALGATALFFGVGYGLMVFPSEQGVGLDPVVSYDMTILLSLALAPLFRFVQGLPALMRADTSLDRITRALDALERERDAGPGRGGRPLGAIRLEGLAFAYGPHFGVGPVDLTLEPGRITLVTGGNGSGKTTLMKMLLGLYPCRGAILWGGRRVGPALMADYRGLFTAVFDGAHLFDRLYGLDVPAERVEALLDRFGLAHVIEFDGEGFGEPGLSAGQRMRLAMVVALLEDRPVLVLDEWTAHQDPETTRWYYEALLPELAAEGRAVVAVSHDERYFGRCDQRLVLDGGQARVMGPADPG